MHTNCAYWSKGVELYDNNILMNIESSISKNMHNKCLLCKKGEASIYCQGTKCGKTFHFICAIIKGCIFTKDRTIYCQKCQNSFKDESEDIINNINHKMIKVDNSHERVIYNVGSYQKLGPTTIYKFPIFHQKLLTLNMIDLGLIKITDHKTNEALILSFNEHGSNFQKIEINKKIINECNTQFLL